MVPGRNQVVSCALGAGGSKNGGGDFQEALLGHQAAQLGNHLAAQHDVVLHRRIPQVEEAVFQAGILIGIPGLVDFKGQLVVDALAQHLNIGGDNLNVAGGQLGVLALPLPHDAGDGDGGLLVDGLDQLHHFLGFHNHLGGAVVVPQNQECKIGADFPDVFQPADNGNLLAHIGKTQFAAGMSSGLLHNQSLSYF